MDADASSDSDSSGGAGEREGAGAERGASGREGSWWEFELLAFTEIGFRGAGAGMSLSANGFGLGGGGVSSMVECLPVVQGGIDRNSSKVRTLGLQHVHPAAQSDLRACSHVHAVPPFCPS